MSGAAPASAQRSRRRSSGCCLARSRQLQSRSVASSLRMQPQTGAGTAAAAPLAICQMYSILLRIFCAIYGQIDTYFFFVCCRD